MDRFETAQMIPDLGGRRFSQVSIGAPNVARVRLEFALLAEAVALTLHVETEALTLDMVRQYIERAKAAQVPAGEAVDILRA